MGALTPRIVEVREDFRNEVNVVSCIVCNGGQYGSWEI